MKPAFWSKLIERLDRLDPGSVQAQFLRLASERGLLETIFHALREGILVLDAAGRIVYANRGAGRLLGFDAEAAAGQPMGRYVREIDWPGLVRLEEPERTRMASREIVPGCSLFIRQQARRYMRQNTSSFCWGKDMRRRHSIRFMTS